jgi:hypothetical protein
MMPTSREEYLAQILKYPPEEALYLVAFDIKQNIGNILSALILLSEDPKIKELNASNSLVAFNEIMDLLTGTADRSLQITDAVYDYVEEYRKRNGTSDNNI